MELKVGSNVFRGASGVLKLEGKEQLVIEIRQDPQVLLTMDFYDPGGGHIAHLRRNVWGFNSKNRLELKTSASLSLFTYPASYRISDRQTGETLLDLELVKADTVHVVSARIYSHKGHLLEVTPHYWRFAAQPKMFGSVQDLRGAAVVIGPVLEK